MKKRRVLKAPVRRYIMNGRDEQEALKNARRKDNQRAYKIVFVKQLRETVYTVIFQ